MHHLGSAGAAGCHQQLWVLLPLQEWRAHSLNVFLYEDLMFCSDSFLDLVSESRCEENRLKLMFGTLRN